MKIMIKKFMASANALTASDVELPILTQDIERLENLHEILKESTAKESLSYCFVSTMLLATKEDVLSQIKTLEQVLRDDEKSQLKTELSDNLASFKNLLARSEKLEEEFRPYLFCPALEEQS